MAPVVGVAQDPEVPNITVMTFQSEEHGLGAKAADALRDRLTDEISSKQLYTIPTTDVATNLEASGFSIEEPLPAPEERQLANMLRADIYVTGVISRKANGGRYHLEPRLVLSHDLTLVQPLPAVDGKDLGDMMKPIAKAVREATKQLDGNKICMAALTSGNTTSALAGARAAIAVYPKATIARLCMARAFQIQYAKATSAADSARYADSILAVSQAVLQQDSLNVQALQYGAAFYKARADTARERQALLNLVRVDSSNPQTVVRVINSLLAEQRIQDAIPLVKDLLHKNPGDSDALRLAFSVYATAQDWQSVVDVGAALVKADTTAADSMYFRRMVIAYDNLKQPQKATDMLTRATAKYPNNSYFWFYYATVLKSDGQTPQAIEAYQRVITLNQEKPGGTATHPNLTWGFSMTSPNDPSVLTIAYLNIAKLYIAHNASDSVYAVVQRMAQLPEVDATSKKVAAGIVSGHGAMLLGNVTAGTPPPPGEQLRAKLQYALKFLQLSNQIAPSVDAQYLIGAANFNIMQSAVTDAEANKSCPLAQLAQQTYSDAKSGLQAGVSKPDYQVSAQDMLGYLPKYSPAIESYIKKFCH